MNAVGGILLMHAAGLPNLPHNPTKTTSEGSVPATEAIGSHEWKIQEDYFKKASSKLKPKISSNRHHGHA